MVVYVNRLAYVMVLLVCLSIVMYPFLAQNQTASESVERAHQLVFNLTQYVYVEGDCVNDPFHDKITGSYAYGVWILLSRQTSKTYELIQGLEPTPGWWTYNINRYAETGGKYTNEYVVTFYYTTTTTAQVNMKVSTDPSTGTAYYAFFIPSRTYSAYNVYRWILRVPYVWYNQSGVTIYAQPWSPVKTPWQSGQWQLTDTFMYGNTQVSVSPTYAFSIAKINDYQIQFSYSIIFQNSGDIGKTIDFYGLVYSYSGGAVTQTLLSASFPAFTISQVGDALVFVFNVYLVSS
jgi:hypothetical protein